jgi:hypothetical protein
MPWIMFLFTLSLGFLSSPALAAKRCDLRPLLNHVFPNGTVPQTLGALAARKPKLEKHVVDLRRDAIFPHIRDATAGLQGESDRMRQVLDDAESALAIPADPRTLERLRDDLAIEVTDHLTEKFLENYAILLAATDKQDFSVRAALYMHLLLKVPENWRSTLIVSSHSESSLFSYIELLLASKIQRSFPGRGIDILEHDDVGSRVPRFDSLALGNLEGRLNILMTSFCDNLKLSQQGRPDFAQIAIDLRSKSMVGGRIRRGTGPRDVNRLMIYLRFYNELPILNPEQKILFIDFVKQAEDIIWELSIKNS